MKLFDMKLFHIKLLLLLFPLFVSSQVCDPGENPCDINSNYISSITNLTAINPPCGPYGRCTPFPNTDKSPPTGVENKITCICNMGFKGYFCETNPCSGFCKNNGTCRIQGATQRCDCPNGTFGIDCSINTNNGTSNNGEWNSIVNNFLYVWSEQQIQSTSLAEVDANKDHLCFGTQKSCNTDNSLKVTVVTFDSGITSDERAPTLYFGVNSESADGQHFDEKLVGDKKRSATIFPNAKMAFGDMDKDGDFDALISTEDGYIKWCQNMGSKSSPYFMGNNYCQQIASGLSTSGIAIGDINFDSNIDFVVGSPTGEVNVYLGNITGGWNLSSTVKLIEGPVSPAIITNEDEKSVILLVGSDHADGRILWYDFSPSQTGTTNGTLSIENPTCNKTKTLEIVDIDRDGADDLLVGCGNGTLVNDTKYYRQTKYTNYISNSRTLRIWELASQSNNPTVRKKVWQGYGGIGNNYSDISTVDIDGDGDKDLYQVLSSGSIKFYLNQGFIDGEFVNTMQYYMNFREALRYSDSQDGSGLTLELIVDTTNLDTLGAGTILEPFVKFGYLTTAVTAEKDLSSVEFVEPSNNKLMFNMYKTALNILKAVPGFMLPLGAIRDITLWFQFSVLQMEARTHLSIRPNINTSTVCDNPDGILCLISNFTNTTSENTGNNDIFDSIVFRYELYISRRRKQLKHTFKALLNRGIVILSETDSAKLNTTIEQRIALEDQDGMGPSVYEDRLWETVGTRGLTTTYGASIPLHWRIPGHFDIYIIGSMMQDIDAQGVRIRYKFEMPFYVYDIANALFGIDIPIHLNNMQLELAVSPTTRVAAGSGFCIGTKENCIQKKCHYITGSFYFGYDTYFLYNKYMLGLFSEITVETLFSVACDSNWFNFCPNTTVKNQTLADISNLPSLIKDSGIRPFTPPCEAGTDESIDQPTCCTRAEINDPGSGYLQEKNCFVKFSYAPADKFTISQLGSDIEIEKGLVIIGGINLLGVGGNVYLKTEKKYGKYQIDLRIALLPFEIKEPIGNNTIVKLTQNPTNVTNGLTLQCTLLLEMPFTFDVNIDGYLTLPFLGIETQVSGFINYNTVSLNAGINLFNTMRANLSYVMQNPVSKSESSKPNELIIALDITALNKLVRDLQSEVDYQLNQANNEVVRSFQNAIDEVDKLSSDSICDSIFVNKYSPKSVLGESIDTAIDVLSFGNKDELYEVLNTFMKDTCKVIIMPIFDVIVVNVLKTIITAAENTVTSVIGCMQGLVNLKPIQINNLTMSVAPTAASIPTYFSTQIIGELFGEAFNITPSLSINIIDTPEFVGAILETLRSGGDILKIVINKMKAVGSNIANAFVNIGANMLSMMKNVFGGKFESAKNNLDVIISTISSALRDFTCGGGGGGGNQGVTANTDIFSAPKLEIGAPCNVVFEPILNWCEHGCTIESKCGDCSSDSDCAADKFCFGSTCLSKKKNGNACVSHSECQSGICELFACRACTTNSHCQNTYNTLCDTNRRHRELTGFFCDMWECKREPLQPKRTQRFVQCLALGGCCNEYGEYRTDCDQYPRYPFWTQFTKKMECDLLIPEYPFYHDSSSVPKPSCAVRVKYDFEATSGYDPAETHCGEYTQEYLAAKEEAAKQPPQCNPGQYFVTSTQTCSPCPDKQYQENTGQPTSCNRCPDGHQFINAQTKCIPCPNGKHGYQSESDDVSEYYISTCTDCLEGKYNNRIGVTECKFCPAGKETRKNVISAIDCVDCPVGQTSYTHNVFQKCRKCLAGKFGNTSGQKSCLSNCAAGQYSLAGSESCSNTCPLGTIKIAPVSESVCNNPKTFCSVYNGCAKEDWHLDANGNQIENVQCTALGGRCEPCPERTYADYPIERSSECKFCPAGWYGGHIYGNDLGNSELPTSKCYQCSGGQYQNEDGSTAKSYYVSNRASSRCKKCPSGMKSSIGSTSCVNTCEEISPGVCKHCFAGKYTVHTADGSASCEDCPRGMYGEWGNQNDERELINIGGYYNLSKPKACKFCPAGRYQDNVLWRSQDELGQVHVRISGQQTCKECPLGYYSAGNGKYTYYVLPALPTVVEAWENDIDKRTKCIKCDSGKYSDELGSVNESFCKLCPRGKEQKYSDYYMPPKKCTFCPRGKYNNQLGGDCMYCPPGTFSDVIGLSTCKECEAGKFSNQNGHHSCGVCTDGFSVARASQCNYLATTCPAGTHTDVANRACVKCDAGKFSTIGATTCRYTNNTCPVGTTAYGTNACQSCTQGRYNDQIGGTCKVCPKNYYNNETNSLECKACPAGKHTAQTASMNSGDCLNCATGQYSSSPGQSCNHCMHVPGKYQDQVGAVTCKNCPSGRYQPPVTASYVWDGDILQCIGCEVGLYQDENGTTACKTCPPGKSHSLKNASSVDLCEDCPKAKFGQNGICEDCPLGRYGNQTGLPVCNECPVYFNQSTKGQTECLRCPYGRYSDVGQATCDYDKFSCPKGMHASEWSFNIQCRYPNTIYTDCQSVCVNCEVGKYNNQTGQQDCQDCSYGKISIEGSSNSSQCKLCPAGKQKKSNICVNCPVGYYSKKLDGDIYDCALCESGKYSDETGLEQCKDCTAGRFGETMTNGWQTKCSDCPSGKVSGPGAVECILCTVGQYPLNNTCTSCDKGKHSHLAGNSICTQCSEGEYADEKGLTWCKTCPSGKTSVSASTALSNCTECPTGTHMENSACAACPQGRYNDENGQSFCKDCDYGKYSNETGQASDTTCLVCPIGKSTFGETMAVECSNCPSGYVNDANETQLGWHGGNWSDYCALCPAGKYSDSGSDCEVCQPGNGSSIRGQPCTFCPSGKQTQAGVCTDCESGKYSNWFNENNQLICEQCPEGKHSNNGSAFCSTRCPYTESDHLCRGFWWKPKTGLLVDEWQHKPYYCVDNCDQEQCCDKVYPNVTESSTCKDWTPAKCKTANWDSGEWMVNYDTQILSNTSDACCIERDHCGHLADGGGTCLPNQTVSNNDYCQYHKCQQSDSKACCRDLEHMYNDVHGDNSSISCSNVNSTWPDDYGYTEFLCSDIWYFYFKIHTAQSSYNLLNCQCAATDSSFKITLCNKILEKWNNGVDCNV
jgi:hypothetical protein